MTIRRFFPRFRDLLRTRFNSRVISPFCVLNLAYPRFLSESRTLNYLFGVHSAKITQSHKKLISGTRNCHLKSLITQKAVEYTTTLGSYKEWKTDVNLDSPDPDVPLTKDDAHIYDYYNALQYSLYENNLPETIDRTHCPREHTPDTRVAIVILSSPVECMGILLEGGRQCPGDMLLVMSPTWLVKEKSENGEGLHSLYVKKAIVFYRGGFSFIDVFQQPRKCTYFVNYFTKACTDGQRSDGEDLEVDLDCPMSSSLELCKRIDDKILTRTLMSDAGIHYPATLAITFKPSYKYTVPNNDIIKLLNFDNKFAVAKELSTELKHFLNSKPMISAQKVVVKPSGAMWHGSRGVTLHDVTDFDGILNAAINLYDALEEENAVLIEAFHDPAWSTNKEFEEYSFRLRANVCRKHDDSPVTTLLVCGIGPKNKPINGDNTIPHSFDTTLRMWGVDQTECHRLEESVIQGSQKIMESIIKYEKGLVPDIKGGVGARTDLIGVDYVLGEVSGKLEPICIEVNSHDCTINCQLFEFMNPDRQGDAVRPYVETMIRRSQLFAMQGKRVLVVGAGGYSKRFIFDEYKSFGIELVLVDPDDTNNSATKATKYIKYNFLDHTKDDAHATEILKLLHEKDIHIDGCVAFWEDCGPLAATICDLLGLYGPSKRGAEVAKMKSWTQSVLRTRTGDIPHFPRSHLYSSTAYHIESEEDIAKAANTVGFPAILKLEYGSSAVGVTPVHDAVQCADSYHRIKENLQSEEDHPGIGLGYGNDLYLMEFLEGTEHDIDIIIFRRQLIAAFVSDNGPTAKGKFTETAACMPTCLPPDGEGMLKTAAYQCCTEVGLVDGVFNVEMKMTNTGPKLIEINARMGGFYLRDWILACFGEDLLLYSFMCCLGIRPIIAKPQAKCHIMGTMCVPSAHKDQLKDQNKLDILNTMTQNRSIRYNQIEASLDDCGGANDEEPFCNIAVVESNRKLAKARLLQVFTEMGLHKRDYDLNYFLQDFEK